MDNINDIIASLTDDDINMLKGVASSILGSNDNQNQQGEGENAQNSSKGNNQQSKPQQNFQSSSPLPANLSLDNIDFDMIMKAKNIFDKMNSTSNKNTDLILALKPHLKPEMQNKADQAVRILKLFDILPLLKELF